MPLSPPPLRSISPSVPATSSHDAEDLDVASRPRSVGESAEGPRSEPGAYGRDRGLSSSGSASPLAMEEALRRAAVSEDDTEERGVKGMGKRLPPPLMLADPAKHWERGLLYEARLRFLDPELEVRECQQNLGAVVDAAVSAAFHEAVKAVGGVSPEVEWTLAGAGSFGREEMCPNSDVEYALVVGLRAGADLAPGDGARVLQEAKRTLLAACRHARDLLRTGEEVALRRLGWELDSHGGTPHSASFAAKGLLATPQEYLAQMKDNGRIGLINKFIPDMRRICGSGEAEVEACWRAMVSNRASETMAAYLAHENSLGTETDYREVGDLKNEVMRSAVGLGSRLATCLRLMHPETRIPSDTVGRLRFAAEHIVEHFDEAWVEEPKTGRRRVFSSEPMDQHQCVTALLTLADTLEGVFSVRARMHVNHGADLYVGPGQTDRITALQERLDMERKTSPWAAYSDGIVTYPKVVELCPEDFGIIQACKEALEPARNAFWAIDLVGSVVKPKVGGKASVPSSEILAQRLQSRAARRARIRLQAVRKKTDLSELVGKSEGIRGEDTL